jgi:hypothetical protein
MLRGALFGSRRGRRAGRGGLRAGALNRTKPGLIDCEAIMIAKVMIAKK